MIKAMAGKFINYYKKRKLTSKKKIRKLDNENDKGHEMKQNISWFENVWLKEKEYGREIERKWEGTW